MSCDNLLSEVRKDIILSLANHNMNESEVARELFMHRNTVVYNIMRIRQITGKDPMNFYDLHNSVGY
jgi:DNA-binding PucR family transcriptional regulator